ncbi:MAG: GNAT family N-acetyltransferase [Calditrichia bacterium]
MILQKPITGKHIRLRTAVPNDAEFALSLRLDSELGRFLKTTDPSVEKQRAWITRRMDAEGDYHMIIESLEGKPLGIVALYDIQGKVFDWGRWIIARESPFTTSIESMLLLYYLGFETLKLERSDFEVRKGNHRVVAFHPTYGAEIRGEDETFIYYRFTAEQFYNDENRLLKRWKKNLQL